LLPPLLADEPLLLPPLFADDVLEVDRLDEEPPLLPPPLLPRDELPVSDERAAPERDELLRALLVVDPALALVPPEDERDDDEPPLLPREAVERAVPPELPPLLLRDEAAREPPRDEPPELPPLLRDEREPLSAVSGVFRREVLRFSFRPRPALKPMVVRSGILISAPVRGLRPVRAARVRLVNFPNPGIDSDPAACTASAMAPDAVSKIASTTRAAAARVSSARSATASMNSDLFMSPLSGMGGSDGAARPRRERDTQTRFHRLLGGNWNRLAPARAHPRPNPERNESTTFRAASAAWPKLSLALSR
jgi:hypothetical protein